MTLLSGCIGAGDNSDVTLKSVHHFPVMEGIDLQGNERQLPGTFQGDLNIVAIGFEREHQNPINTWIPFSTEMTNTFEGVRFYEVPIIYEMSSMGRFWVNNGMRSGIEDEAARERTITVYTDRDKIIDVLQLDPTHSYTLLVTNEGKIVWRAKGAMTEDTKRELEGYITSTLPQK